ncbi:MAG: rhodanese-like domain-containing protein [Proteobacteria bacterium]|nr:rhodanese-like domain-containing protein [Pseudomonadota bacterium]
MNSYLLPILGVAAFFAWRGFQAVRVRDVVRRLLAEGACVIDVRGPAEFAAGHAPGSVNVPLPELAEATLAASTEQPLIVCCATGTRSAIARGILARRGYRHVVNAGSWINVVKSASR